VNSRVSEHGVLVCKTISRRVAEVSDNFFVVGPTAIQIHFFLNRDMEAIRSLSNQVVIDKEMMGIMNPPAFRYLSITYR
jgi:hypothetical protein